MGVYEIIITKRAESDLQNIWKYIANDLSELDTADKMLVRIDEGIIKFEKLPKRHKLVNDSRLDICPLHIEMSKIGLQK